jgi:ABC-type transport system involved in cytochrome bd biosynthesis fused ATPase/permease subunit
MTTRWLGFRRLWALTRVEIEQGESVAIVGASGCGKSTMLKLLAGLFKPKPGCGTVTLDGTELEEYDTTRLIAWMEQESRLLTGTLRDNLIAGPGRAISDQELMHVCELCRFDYANLAQGLDTYLGQNGNKLSVGDRQRIACARTTLLRRPLVVCDEPTSAKDPATSQPVLNALLNCEWDPAPGGPPVGLLNKFANPVDPQPASRLVWRLNP